jgi:DNA segregation ATPase FtsK/SpoIIIE-like protein
MDIILSICAVVSTICLVLISINIETMLSAISKQLYNLDAYTQGNNKVLQELRDIEKIRLNGEGELFNIIADSSDEDSLYEEAKELVIKSGKASPALLQRRLRIGYSRSARLIDMLEENNVVGKADGTKPREILKAN